MRAAEAVRDAAAEAMRAAERPRAIDLLR
jgi:hypothetical protein